MGLVLITWLLIIRIGDTVRFGFVVLLADIISLSYLSPKVTMQWCLGKMLDLLVLYSLFVTLIIKLKLLLLLFF